MWNSWSGLYDDFHIDSLKRLSFVEVNGITDLNTELAKKKSNDYSLPKFYKSVDELLSDGEISAVYNCTPNNLHFKINKEIIESGKYVFSEKPLAINSIESKELLILLDNNPDIVGELTFCIG